MLIVPLAPTTKTRIVLFLIFGHTRGGSRGYVYDATT
jgi:hypothetical protein